MRIPHSEWQWFKGHKLCRIIRMVLACNYSLAYEIVVAAEIHTMPIVRLLLLTVGAIPTLHADS